LQAGHYLPFTIFCGGYWLCSADILSGYITYAPATFVIKGLMACNRFLFIYKFYMKKSAIFRQE
jgi:hypothetical protein